MHRILEQSPVFRRSYKKLHNNQIKNVNDAIRAIQANPEIGELKKGDLTGIRVYKFQVLDQQFLLSYEFDDYSVFLTALNTHENFYRNLKKNHR